jgi:TonB-linked SusC/RagA family outer membrane protein
MKKTITKRKLIAVLMKTSVSLLLIVLVASMTFGRDGFAQDVLNRMVSVEAEQRDLKLILSQLEKTAKVRFSYVPSLVRDRKVSLMARNLPLEDVLTRLLRPLHIQYVVSGGYIILNREPTPSQLPSSVISSTDMASTGTARPEDETISGKVSDEKGQGLPGVSVVMKGTARGTTTDIDGNYRLVVPAKGTVLVFSFVGYVPQEITVGAQNVIAVSLQPDTKALNEVVVVGFGEQKKATVTGAIAQVGEEVFKDRPVANTAVALQGQVPGLIIQRTSARPGNEGLNIRLRGESSVTGVEPLIIIDGVPSVVGSLELNTINPNDIESVVALKDASAAIYGARAQGGVLLITTKRGKGGKMQVSLNSNFRLNTIGINVPWANMSQWAQQYLVASTQDKVDASGNPVEWFPQWTKENLQKMATGQAFDYTNPSTGLVSHYADNNWQNALYGPAWSNQQNLNIRGSSDKTAYLFSLGFSDNRSLLKTAYDGEKKYNLRFNYDYTISKRIKLETGMSYDNRTVQNPRFGLSGSNTGFFDAPVFPAYNLNGDYYDDYGYRNPVAFTQSGGTSKNNEAIMRLNARLGVELVTGLKLTANGAVTKRDNWATLYSQRFNFYSWTGDRITSTQNTLQGITETINNTLYQNYGVQLDYVKTIARDHDISFMVANTAELNDTKGVTAGRANLDYAGLFTLNTASPNTVSGGVTTNTQTNSGTASHWGLVSYISRFNYSFRQKYLFEALGRRDGSSRFDMNNRWANFYGLSAGWRLSEEGFVKNLNLFNNLKLRASYGETGGQASLGNYDYVSTIGIGSALFGATPSLQTSAFLSAITTDQRSWERMVNKDVGLDFAMLNNRLSGSIDLFEKKNVGMLIGITYPSILGGTAPTTNSGTLRTRGWEVAMNWKSNVGRVNYNVGVQLSDNTNNIVSYQGKDSWAAGKFSPRQGYPLNALFVYKTDGYFANKDDVAAYYAKYGGKGNLSALNGATTTLRPGDLKVVDLDGDGQITATGTGLPGSGDVYYYGDANPHYSFGVNLGAQWKGFDFSAFVQGVGQWYILRGGNARAPFFRNYVNVNTSYIGKTWTPETPDAQYPRMSFDATRNNWNWQFNDVNIQNLRYARLKSLIIGYTVPQQLTSKIKTDRIRVYFSGNVLFELTSVKDGFDPERGESSDSTYPFFRTWSFGIDLSF